VRSAEGLLVHIFAKLTAAVMITIGVNS